MLSNLALVLGKSEFRKGHLWYDLLHIYSIPLPHCSFFTIERLLFSVIVVILKKTSPQGHCIWIEFKKWKKILITQRWNLRKESCFEQRVGPTNNCIGYHLPSCVLLAFRNKSQRQWLEINKIQNFLSPPVTASKADKSLFLETTGKEMGAIPRPLSLHAFCFYSSKFAQGFLIL